LTLQDAATYNPAGDAVELRPREEGAMVRTIIYWITTAIVSLMLMFALMYLTGNEQVTSGFAKVGYPQHLRIVLGIAKPLAGLVLLLPGLLLLKEWAYAGAAFTWIMAVIAHYSAGEGVQVWSVPLTLLILLVVSYATRPPARRLNFALRAAVAGSR
jgi:hypothetical protein